MKRLYLSIFLLSTAVIGAFAQTATKYYVAHQGGYIGEATVTIKGNQGGFSRVRRMAGSGRMG